MRWFAVGGTACVPVLLALLTLALALIVFVAVLLCCCGAVCLCVYLCHCGLHQDGSSTNLAKAASLRPSAKLSPVRTSPGKGGKGSTSSTSRLLSAFFQSLIPLVSRVPVLCRW
jgi:hypothetical protein